MKEIERQKQKLSIDLADRANTILKLLEDNKALHEKLDAAQREAELGLGDIIGD